MSRLVKSEERRIAILELQGNGMSQKDIARQLKISPSTVQRYVRETKASATSGVIVTESIKAKIDGAINPIEQLVTLNEQIWSILKDASEEDEKSGKVKNVTLIFESHEQILKQLKLHHDILKTVYDVENVQAFQRTVLETMDEVDPKMREEFVRRLNSKNIMRGVTIL